MPPVEKSASKWSLMLALGLDENSRAHQELYNAMKKEVVLAYDDSLKGCRHNLKPEYADNPEPWSYSQFTEIALGQVIETIRTSAGPNTWRLYAQGERHDDNWVIRWFLYHICRYRDLRNRRASRSNKFHEDDEAEAAGVPVSLSSRTSPHHSKTGRNYDAARNSYK